MYSRAGNAGNGKKKSPPRVLIGEWYHNPEGRPWEGKAFGRFGSFIPGGAKAFESLKLFVWNGLSEEQRTEWLGEGIVYLSEYYTKKLRNLADTERGKVTVQSATSGAVGELLVGNPKSERRKEQRAKPARVEQRKEQKRAYGQTAAYKGKKKTEDQRQKEAEYRQTDEFKENDKKRRGTDAYKEQRRERDKRRRTIHWGKLTKHVLFGWSC